MVLANLSVEQSLMKASSYAKKGEVDEAKKLYQTILRKFSNNIRAQQGLAALNKYKQSNSTQSPPQEAIDELVNLFNQGQILAVIGQAEVLTEQYPDSAVVWNILGASRAQIGNLDEAIEAYKKTISLKPDYAEAYSNMGVALRKQGKFEEAIEAYKKSISIKPNYAEAYNNMGVTFKDQGKFDEAIEAYKKSILLKPNYAEAYDNMGVALKNKGKFDEAIEAYHKAISIKPIHANTYYNMGNALRDQLKLDEAIEYYNKSISLNPNYTDAFNNMGIALHYQDKSEEAIQAYRKAISFNPDSAETHQNLGFMLLRSGKLTEGLDELEWRWKNPQFLSIQRHFLQPLWDGTQSLKDKKILIWSEQGVGDTINWSSLLPLITHQAKHCILECQPKLVSLLERSFPNVEVKPTNRNLDLKRDDFDFHLPMGSIHKYFIQEFVQIVKAKSFLVPDPIRVNFWKKHLKSLGNGPYIGISWKSSNMSSERLPNYSSISEWSQILTIPNITFINLQSKNFADDLIKVQNEIGVKINNFDDLDQFNNIADVAALCTALDMVVSNHGTLPLISVGVGTLTKLANWRQSPWNNILNNPVGSSVDIFERDTLEPWDNVFNLIREDIIKLTENWSS